LRMFDFEMICNIKQNNPFDDQKGRKND